MSYVAFFLLGIGAVFVLLAGVGLLRMPTLFMRLQVASKASTLGVISMVIGLWLYMPKSEVFLKAVLTCVLLLVTATLASHAIALAAKKHGYDE